MELLTLAKAREYLWNQASNKTYDETDAAEVAAVNRKINLASARFFSNGTYRGTLTRAAITAYNNVLTLPRRLQTVIGGKLESSTGIPVQSIWFELLPGLHSSGIWSHFADLGDGFTTFRDADAAIPVRIYNTEAVDSTATLVITGQKDDFTQYTFEVALDGTTANIPYNTTKILRLHKDVTVNPVSIYQVDDDDVEWLVGTMDATETDANYRRYRAPTSADGTAVYDCICKRAFITAVNDWDLIVPNNIAALKQMLMAIDYEDKKDTENSDIYTARAIATADADRQQFDGDSQTPLVNMDIHSTSGSIPTIDIGRQ